MNEVTSGVGALGKRPYYRPTTFDQRRLLIDVWKATDSPRKACAAAHVGMSTFQLWRKRFVEGGYAALEECRSHAPHSFPNQLAASVLEEVKVAKREHPEWGRRRIAQELAKAHDWQSVVSASEVKRILADAGMWPVAASNPKG